eukprot:TRINITY_DN1134_c0_g1_i1.p1 TRINITY_DN1134_c0_g1~~TRINITY_DN1134_c0_g1_i1.p1  ORF type:complete len:444 (+),score=80.57 TRINITY_DN1134_c0_g1_i1:63-1334(+)
MNVQELTELVESIKEEGNQLFMRGLYREAKEKFEFGLRLQPKNKFLLSNLAGCLIQMGKFSEAGETAEKVIEIEPNWIRGYHRKAMALFGLERYDEAKEQIMIALQLDPDNESLKGDMFRIEDLLKESKAKIRDINMEKDDFECVLCLKLFYNPVTTPCGHSFCKNCLLRSLDHANICPLCRNVVLFSQDHPISVTLQNIIQNYFPEEYAKRAREEKIKNETFAEQLPLFVLDAVAYPNQDFPMHIFEPRYRLMIRRAMESNKRFGLISCTVSDTAGVKLNDVGTCLRINDIKILPDGRIFVSTTGTKRFRVLNTFEVDGYKVAKIEWVEDQNQEITPELVETANLLKSLLVNMMPTFNLNPKTLSHYNETVEALDEDDVVSLIWLILATFPFPKDAKNFLLESRSIQQRVAIIKEILLSANT